MKNKFIKIGFISFIFFSILSLIFDYMNLPTALGFDMSNFNLDFCMGILNTIVILLLYYITYKTLDERTMQRENNKINISKLLIKNCYEECLQNINFLDEEIVEKYIIPKVDFNSTENKAITNLQNIPFHSENAIFDLVKDGQIEKKTLEIYLIIKNKFRQYVTMRITCFDSKAHYDSLKIELSAMLKKEISNINNQIIL